MARSKDAHSPRFRAVLAGALAALAAAVLALPAQAGAADKGVVPDLTWGTPSADQDRTAGAIRDVGARWVRLNANWSDAEPSRGTYNDWWLRHYDRAVDLARSAGAQVVLMSYQSPSWASGSSVKETPPRDPADYARFMGFLAKRYAGKVAAYEIWNEQNIQRFWSTGPNARDYVDLLKPAYQAIKAADPNAKVVFGGLSTNDWRYVEQAYAAGAKGHFDVMSVHPYTCANSPETIRRDGSGRMTHDTYAGYREVRASMVANGDAKPIWFTEFGWGTTSQSCGVSEATQADFLTRALRFAEQDPYVEVALWYNFRNNYWDRDADSLESRYGLMRSDFSHKPSYDAFKSYAPGQAPPPSSPAGAKKRRTSTKVSVTSSASASRNGRSSRRSRTKRQIVVGKVVGATGGRVTLRLQRRARGKWGKTVVRSATVAVSGRFKQRLGTRVKSGRWRVRAAYEGGADCERSQSRYLVFHA